LLASLFCGASASRSIKKSMRLYRLECEMTVPIGLQETFSVFENPHNLARITPAWLGFRITSGERVTMRRGTEITYSIRWAGIPLSWTSVITEYEPPFHFVDEQARGPYRFWRHRHSFRPSTAGTVVCDSVEYALPFGWLGRLAHGLIVGRQLRRIFDYRQKALAELMGVLAAGSESPAIAIGET
jgi:ligand-binding SRPBCC domain-containing protein